MSEKTKNISNYIKLLCASTAGISGTLVCYPFDVLRINMQMVGAAGQKTQEMNTWQLTKSIVKNDGIIGLYRGLSASIARQGLYTGTRLGLFQILNDYVSPDGNSTFLQKCLIGSISGVCGGIIGLPPDVVLSRMAVDSRLPKDERRNYRNVIHGGYRIYKNEGFFTLYRGATPTILRAVAVNITQVVSYFQTKEFLLNMGVFPEDNIPCQFACSVVSSFVTTACALPLDITKTRIQNMKVINGVPEYSSMIDVWYNILKNENIFALWKGFTPLFIRNAPQFIVTFVAYEKLTELFHK